MSGALGLVGLSVASGPASAGPASASDTSYGRAYALGLKAYTYGLPLLITNRTFHSMTSINVSNGTGYGPANRFNHVRKPANPADTAVVAQSTTGLSSTAWLTLTTEPQVLHVPRVTNRYFSFDLIDPYTEDFRDLGTITGAEPGDYVIAGPGQHHVRIPKGTHRLNVSYSRIWIIGTTLLKGPNDVANVNKIQNLYTLTPLSNYGTNYHPKRPVHPDTHINKPPLPTGMRFFDVLGSLLKQFPPPAADHALLRQLATVGIGPGRTPSHKSHLDSATRSGLAAAAAAGPA
ncbi:MAG TPA: DUF1254 domain-containing protein, partial [Nakamurella sp.]|nr:DUF1254 domain-containing protein [Nakamurella sp.]